MSQAMGGDIYGRRSQQRARSEDEKTTDLAGNIQVVVDRQDGNKYEAAASSPQNSGALVVGTRRRHNKSSSPTPKQQISVGRNHQGNNNNAIQVFIDTSTTGKVEEEEEDDDDDDEEEEEKAPLPPTPLAGGSQGDVELEAVDDKGSQQEQQGDNEADERASSPANGGGGGAAGGLPEQALMTIIGNYFERVGQIIALIGLGTITSTIGGLFTRGPPLMFRYIIDQDNENDDIDDVRAALITYYICLPGFFVVGLLELCYGIWVSRNQTLRAGKRAKTVLIFSAVLLIITVCFTGAGVNV